MNPDQPQPTYDESVKQVLQSLPAPLRTYLEEAKYAPASAMLSHKYALGPVQEKTLKNGLVFLLMGIDNPDEFATSLRGEAKLSDDVVRSIMTDVNEEVFLPLQEEMKRAENTPVAQAPVPTPPAPPRPATVFTPVDPASRSYAPPLQSPRYPGQSADMVANGPAQATPMRPTAPGVIPEGQRFVPKQSALPVTNPGLRAVMTDLKMLEDHEEPHIDLHNGVPANLPGVVIAPVATPLPAQEAQVAPKSVSVPMVPITSYTKDPYREPIDENSL
jgi:hypothetical protein